MASKRDFHNGLNAFYAHLDKADTNHEAANNLLLTERNRLVSVRAGLVVLHDQVMALPGNNSYDDTEKAKWSELLANHDAKTALLEAGLTALGVSYT